MVIQRQFPLLFVAVISGKSCRTKRGLFRRFSEALKFPDYFGKNWDAFEECLTDLEWLNAEGYLIIVSDADALLAKNDEDYKTFVRIVTKAGQAWADRTRPSRPFHLVLTTTSATGATRRRWHIRPTALALSTS
jgi:RNAse (barnase) inhibitor barstar